MSLNHLIDLETEELLKLVELEQVRLEEAKRRRPQEDKKSSTDSAVRPAAIPNARDTAWTSQLTLSPTEEKQRTENEKK